MCGIAGFRERKLFEGVFPRLAHRGRDASRSLKLGDWWVGHHLHATVGFVPQPLVEGDAWFAGNCELYNWRELARRHRVEARNDAELAFRLLLRRGRKALDEFRGPYALAFWDGELLLARDPQGIFPLFYSERGFASERFPGSRELHPRHLLIGGEPAYRGGFRPGRSGLRGLERSLRESVKLRAHGDLTLFLSGLDSALLAAYLKEAGVEFRAVTVGLEGSRDLLRGKMLAGKLGLDWKGVVVSREEVVRAVPRVAGAIQSRHPVKVEVGLVTWFASREAGKVAISGLGADELFGGYARMHRSPRKEALWALRNIYERSTYRDNVLGLRQGTEIRLPYLDGRVVECALGLPGEMLRRKAALRELARPYLGELAGLPKKAAQYGSGFSSVLRKPKRFEGPADRRLAALLSGGKDSWYAMLIARRLGYEVPLAVVIQPEGDSWMFHVPGIESVPEMARRAGMDVLVRRTAGEKEEELAELEDALREAGRTVEGVVVGAISSEYQRERVERICDGLGLSCHAPLWGVEPEAYLRRVSRELRFRVVAVAAHGPDESWVGREITPEAAEELITLSRKYRFNPAGEGGEYETQVIL